MQKKFPRQYYITWLGAVIWFVSTIPWGMFSDARISVHYACFCLVLNGLSTVLFRAILLRVWVRQLYSDTLSVYAWLLAVQAFCHLVFLRMNPMCWAYLAFTAGLWLTMLVLWWKAWKKSRDSEKNA